MSVVANVISGIAKPIAGLIDELHTSDEEKMTLTNALSQMKTDFMGKMLEYEARILEARSSIIQAEANSTHWLAAVWRPIAMLNFLLLINLDMFGWLARPLPEQAWTLLQIGLGGYVVGRTVEKVTPQISEAIRTKVAT